MTPNQLILKVKHAFLLSGAELEQVGDRLVVSAPTSQYEAEVALFNLHRRLLGSPPDQHARLINNFVHQILHTIGVRPAFDPLQLFPQILPWKVEASAWYTTLIEGRLRLGLVQDLGTRLRSVTPFDFPRWSLSMQEAQATALDNLITTTAPPKAYEIEGWTCWRLQDGFDAARVLILEQYREDSCWVAVPSRDLLLTAPQKTPRAQVEEHVQALMENIAYPVSSDIFQWSPEEGLS